MTNEWAVLPKHAWESSNHGNALFFAKGRKPILELIDTYIPDNNGTCLELGCVPGSYLGHMGTKGYTISGIDWTRQVLLMPRQAQKRGFKWDSFFHQDILEFYPQKLYGVVCSFGFIEHFKNWEEMIKRHCELVQENGYVIVTFPNLAGCIARSLYTYLAPGWFSGHHLPAMDAHAQAKIARDMGFEIIFEGYFGGFDFLQRVYAENTFLKKRVFDFVKFVARCGVGERMPSKKSYSPFGGFVARKRRPPSEQA